MATAAGWDAAFKGDSEFLVDGRGFGPIHCPSADEGEIVAAGAAGAAVISAVAAAPDPALATRSLVRRMDGQA